MINKTEITRLEIAVQKAWDGMVAANFAAAITTTREPFDAEIAWRTADRELSLAQYEIRHSDLRKNERKS